jgi:hypothetical protein
MRVHILLEIYMVNICVKQQNQEIHRVYILHIS